MTLVDETTRIAPMARIFISTPYYTGEVEALCLPDALYDLLIDNINGASHPNDPDEDWNIGECPMSGVRFRSRCGGGGYRNEHRIKKIVMGLKSEVLI